MDRRGIDDVTRLSKRLGQEGGAGKRVIGKSGRGGGQQFFASLAVKRRRFIVSRRRRWPRNRTTGSVHRSGKLEGGPGALTPARCRCWSGSAFLPGPICRGWSSRDVLPAVSSIHVTADKISPAPPKAMKITLEFVGWLDERAYIRALCVGCWRSERYVLLSRRSAISRGEREEGEGEKERESVHRTSWRGLPRRAIRVSNVQFLVSMESFSFTVYIGSTQIENFESKFLSDWQPR